MTLTRFGRITGAPGRLRSSLSVAVLGLLLGLAPLAAQTNIEPEEFSAFAVNMGALTSPGGASTANLVITVNRWSTQAEQDRIFALLKEKGPQAMLDALQDLKPVGTIRTTQSIGYDLRLAFQEQAQNGARRVIIATDRPIGFAEASYRGRTLDYPLTIIDMTLPAEGVGKGTMSIAARMIPAGKRLIVENYDTQPVQLNRVEARKLKR